MGALTKIDKKGGKLVRLDTWEPAAMDTSGEAWTRAATDQTRIPKRNAAPTTTSTPQMPDYSRMSETELRKTASIGRNRDYSKLPKDQYRYLESHAQIDLDEDAMAYFSRLNELRRLAAGKPSAGDRVWNAAGAASAGTIGPISSALGTAADAAQRGLEWWSRNSGKRGKSSLDDKTQSGLASLKEGAYRLADAGEQASAQLSQAAKVGQGIVGQTAVDVGIAGGQMALDALASALISGAGNALMMARSFGGASQNARKAGAGLDKQLLSGTGAAAITYATAHLTNLAKPFQKIYGKGLAETIAGRLAGRFGDSAAVNIMTKLSHSAGGRLALSALGEAAEEPLEGYLQAAWDRFVYDPNAEYTKEEAKQDALVAGLLGLVGGGVEVVGQAGRNRAQRQAQTARPSSAAAQQIQGLSTALGEKGKTAIAGTYDGQIDAGTFYDGFSAYYRAGLSGADTAQADRRYGSVLTDAQKTAAYTAGRSDARASLKRERNAARYASTAGTDSGLMYDGKGEGRLYLDTGTAEKVDRVAKALGVRVRFVDAVRGGTANAQIAGNEILVEKNNQNPVLTVIGHELTHRMQALAPAEYRQFRNLAAGKLDYMVQQRIDDYATQGVELSMEDAIDEVAADYAGRLMNDGQVLEDFIRRNQEDRTLLEKIRDVIRAVARKLTGAERTQALSAEQRLTEALEAATAQARALQKTRNSDTIEETKLSLKDLNDTEWTAALQYKSSESYKVNKSLRDRLPLTQAEQKMVDDLDSALEKLPRVKGTVYRTLNFDDISDPAEEFDTFISVHAEGNIVRYGAYTSASTKIDGYPLADGAKYGVVMEISSNSARDLAGIGNGFESEVLFQRGISFVIRSVNIDKNGIAHITMEEVENYAERNEPKHDTQKHGQAVQQVQKQSTVHNNLFEVSKENTGRSADQGGLPGVRSEGNGEVKFSLKEYTDAEKKDYAKAALEHFGRTYSWKETGYLTQDGKKIDFSGRHDGAPADRVKLYQRLLAEMNTERTLEALAQVYQENMKRLNDEETLRNLKWFYEWNLGNSMQEPEDEDEEQGWDWDRDWDWPYPGENPVHIYH